MSGQVCKVIINMLLQALMKALETILLTPAIHRDRLPEDVRMSLIQKLADIDLASYRGDGSLLPDGGLAGIVEVLQDHGMVTDEVWEILHRPEAKAGEGPHRPQRGEGL